MNLQQGSHDSYQLRRLALGVEIQDALAGGRLREPARVDVEGQLPWYPGVAHQTGRSYRRFRHPLGSRPAITRHDTGRYSVLYQTGLPGSLDLRLYDHRRHFAPRRLRVGLLSLESVVAAERAGRPLDASLRICRPAMFPGAAYPLSPTATALRGRVLRDGHPLHWARVDAFLPADPDAPPPPAPVRVGHAHGDDRGEFLLALAPAATQGSELPARIQIQVVVYGPAAPQPAEPAELPELDPWWDLPLEILPPPGAADEISPGRRVPEGYVAGGSRLVTFTVGRTLSAVDDIDDFTFDLPD